MPVEYQSSSRFASPDVKRERLFVLSGGRQPTALFSILKANMSKTTIRDANVIHLVDAIATDVGLLIVPFSKYQGSNVGMAFALGGVAGGLGEAVASKINTVMASRNYDRLRAKEFAKPREISDIYAHRGEFLPADEITQLERPQAHTIQFWCRGIRYTLAEKSADFESFKKWQEDAALVRRELDGGPPNAGIASLLEWGQRTVEQTPPWVDAALREIAVGELDNRGRTIVTSAGVRIASALMKKLRTKSGNDAEHVVGMLQSCIRRRAVVFAIASAVSLLLALIFLSLVLAFSPFQTPSQPNDWIGAVSLFPLVVSPFFSIGFGIAALWVYLKSR